MELLIAFTMFAILAITLYLLLVLLNTRRLKLMQRIEAFNTTQVQKEEKSSMKSFLGSMGGIFLRITPAYKLKKVQYKLEKCGLSKRYTPTEWLVFVYLVSGGSGLVTLLIFALLSGGFIVSHILLTGLVMGFVRYALHFYMVRKMTSRRKEIVKELPFTLDLITVSVQAGLSFDGAILKVVQTRDNALADEFEKLLKEIRIGVIRRQALKNMMDRVSLDEMNTLLLAVIQADELGVSISKVLKIQAEYIREQRKQAAREKALKAPVKMLIPLIIFIFPSIFVIVLGPALIKIMDAFG